MACSTSFGTGRQTLAMLATMALLTTLAGAGSPARAAHGDHDAFLVTPIALAFEDVVVGESTAPQSVRVTNTSGAPATVSVTAVTAPSHVTVDDHCDGAELAPGTSCVVDLSLSPIGAGTITGTVEFAVNGQAASIDVLGQATGALWSPTTDVDFGDTPIGGFTEPVRVEIVNVSSSPILMQGAGGAVGAPFSAAQTCQGQTLAPGASCEMVFRFTPTQDGPESATSNIAWSGQGFAFDLRGNGVPRLHASATEFDFGPVPTGVMAGPIRVDITNVGATAVVMNGAGGGVGAPFSAAQTCQGQTLDPGESCEMIYRFTPTETGSFQATSNIDWNGQPFAFELTGTGVSASATTRIHAYVDGVDLGRVTIGTQSAARTIDIVNMGTDSIVMNGAGGATQAPFSVSQNCQGQTLDPGESCEMFVRFTPSELGPASATSNISWNGFPFSFEVTGVGVPTYHAPLRAIDFGGIDVGEAAPQVAVPLINRAPGSRTPSGLGGGVGAPFFVSDTCHGQVVASGASCQMRFNFMPSVQGPATATSAIQWDGQPYEFDLRGHGLGDLLVTPRGLDFGQVEVGESSAPQAVEVSNLGATNRSIAIDDLSVPNGFVVADEGCDGVELAPGGSCEVALGFAPEAAGDVDDAATLSVNGQPIEVRLVGEGYGVETEPGLVRLAGDDRYETAVAVALDRFDPDDVDTVYLATGLDFPDALAGVPLAAIEGAPILLTRPDALPDVVADAIETLGPTTVVALGGTAAVSAAVLEAAGDLVAATTERLSGADRFATAAAIADAMPSVGIDTVYLATGLDFPDALAGGPVTNGAPILLTRPDRLPDATAAVLAARTPATVVALGGTAVVSETVLAEAAAAADEATAERLQGTDRFETATVIAETLGEVGSVYVAVGSNFPDALSAGPAAAADGAPIVLTRTGALPAVTTAYLDGLTALRRITVLGGRGVIGADVEAALGALLD